MTPTCRKFETLKDFEECFQHELSGYGFLMICENDNMIKNYSDDLFLRYYGKSKIDEIKDLKLKLNTIVKFDCGNIPEEHKQAYLEIFPKGEIYVYMGDLVQMPGHCVLCNYITGKIYCGYHTENFIPLTEDEI